MSQDIKVSLKLGPHKNCIIQSAANTQCVTTKLDLELCHAVLSIFLQLGFKKKEKDPTSSGIRHYEIRRITMDRKYYELHAYGPKDYSAKELNGLETSCDTLKGEYEVHGKPYIFEGVDNIMYLSDAKPRFSNDKTLKGALVALVRRYEWEEEDRIARMKQVEEQNRIARERALEEKRKKERANFMLLEGSEAPSTTRSGTFYNFRPSNTMSLEEVASSAGEMDAVPARASRDERYEREIYKKPKFNSMPKRYMKDRGLGEASGRIKKRDHRPKVRNVNVDNRGFFKKVVDFILLVDPNTS